MYYVFYQISFSILVIGLYSYLMICPNVLNND